MKFSIGLKIAAVVLMLLGLVGSVAWINARSSRHVELLIENVHGTYVPAYGALTRAYVALVEEGLFVRRWLFARIDAAADKSSLPRLKEGVAAKSRETDMELKQARTFIALELADPTSFGDKLELKRLDTALEFLLGRHDEYDLAVAALVDAAERDAGAELEFRVAELDRLRGLFDDEADAATRTMLVLLENASELAVQKQHTSVRIGLVLLTLALALGALTAAMITIGLVRPLRRLLAGTLLIQQGRLDVEVPVTSRDEVGELTAGFNTMVRELRSKDRIRETFGRYMDPRIVEGLIDQPDRLAGTGDRREMTIFFSDMRGFTNLSEGMTPAGMVRIVNRYLALMSAPVHRNQGVIDKYIGDGIMAFWGPPFSRPEDQARLACIAGLEQLASLAGFRAELPEVTGLRRGLPTIDMRIGIATGGVVVGNIGSEVSMSYTVMGDSVNLASRLEGANKAYGTRFLVNARTAEMARGSIECREIDLILVEGKQEPERIFEVLGRQGEVAAPVREMAQHYAEGLAAYRKRAWPAATAAFAAALHAVPEDGPSREFLRRVKLLEADPPPADWDGVWQLLQK